MSRRLGHTATLVMGGASLAAVAISSCKEPTSVEIEARSSLRAAEIAGVQFTVGGDAYEVEGRAGAGYVNAETSRLDGAGVVGTLVVVPPAGVENARLSFVVVLGFLRPPSSCRAPRYQGCIVARRQLAYRTNQRLRVPVVLDPSCIDVPCDAVSTCARGNCFSSAVTCDDDGECRGADTGGPGTLVDAAGPFDAPPSDGGPLDGAVADAPRDGAIEASDSASDSGGSPGQVLCKNSPPCPLPADKCCAQSGSGSCVAQSMGCAMPAVSVTCDGPEDCGGAELCCALANGTQCTSMACTSVVCRTSADCPGSTCVPNSYSNFYGTCLSL